ncbi:MAG: hypothetical protein ACE5R3_05185 [Nitrosopumilaceae archaeon]
MPTLRRPITPKIKTPRISRKKDLGKSIKINIGTKSPNLIRGRSVKKDKKKSIVRLGTCYKNVGCEGKILLKRVSKARCKAAGGKSWKGVRGCQSIS